jgi:hypothetical protein
LLLNGDGCPTQRRGYGNRNEGIEMTKTIVFAVALVSLIGAAGVATTHATPLQLLGVSDAAQSQTLGHGSERGECGKGDNDTDRDGDRC